LKERKVHGNSEIVHRGVRPFLELHAGGSALSGKGV